MRNLKEVVDLVEKIIPTDLIHDKDNSGLLVGELKNPVQHVRVALEATNEVVDKAIQDGVDLLIVHHPMIFSAINAVTSKTVEGNKVIKLIKNNIGLYAVHSNLDRMENGLNSSFGSRLGLENIELSATETDGYVLKGILDEPLTLKQLVDHVRSTLNVDHIRFVGDASKLVQKVGFCTGSGMSFVADSLFDEIDVYLTGDLKYHDAVWIHESGYAVIDVTHFGSECISTDILYDLIGKELESDIIISKDEAILNPIKVSEV